MMLQDGHGSGTGKPATLIPYRRSAGQTLVLLPVEAPIHTTTGNR